MKKNNYSGIDDSQIKRVLTPDFIQLDRLLKRFNVFNATDMRRREVKHTKFLAHLLNPHESHGLGIRFLEHFIVNLINQSKSQNFDFLSLDLMNAEIISEGALAIDEKKVNSIDLLIIIPNVSQDSQCVLIAIEAKVDSKESHDQLTKYRNLINKKYSDGFNNYFYFLTAKGDDPSDDNWEGVTFGNVILPALETLIKYYKDTISDYLISIIEDYIEIIDGNHIIENEADGLAERISQESLDLIKSLKPNAPVKSHERIIQNKFSAAIYFLRSFDNDVRKRVPLEFENIFRNKSNSSIIFTHETSSRQYLRFSYLSALNDKFFQKICSDTKVSWVNSKRHLTFEFILKESDKSKKINISLKLILGPTSQNFTQREKLADFIVKGIFNEINKKKEVLKYVVAKVTSPVYSTLLGVKDIPKFAKRELEFTTALNFIKESLESQFLIDIAKGADEGVCKFRENEFLEY